MDTLYCNECSSEKQGSSKNGFTKKLLVVTTLVLIIAMCLTPTEARSMEHRQRHQNKKQQGISPQRLTKELTKRPKNMDLHTTLTKKIIKKLKNTRRFFTDARREVSDSKENRYGNPKWLPKVNFMEIHNHAYNDLPSGTPMSAEKFSYVIPKLYKTLLEYKVIWERLQIVNIHHLDVDFLMNYTRKRDSLISTTLAELQKFITEVEDDMEKANVPKPHFNKERMNIEHLHIDNVDTNRCLRQDTIAIRAYANALKKWYWALRCPDESNAKLAKQCKNAQRNLFTKRNLRATRNNNTPARQKRHRQFRLAKV